MANCTTCGLDHSQTPEQYRRDECIANRPRCSWPVGCDKPTCIQAMANGYPPQCLDHFFGPESVQRLRLLALNP